MNEQIICKGTVVLYPQGLFTKTHSMKDATEEQKRFMATFLIPKKEGSGWKELVASQQADFDTLVQTKSVASPKMDKAFSDKNIAVQDGDELADSYEKLAYCRGYIRVKAKSQFRPKVTDNENKIILNSVQLKGVADANNLPVDYVDDGSEVVSSTDTLEHGDIVVAVFSTWGKGGQFPNLGCNIHALKKKGHSPDTFGAEQVDLSAL